MPQIVAVLTIDGKANTAGHTLIIVIKHFAVNKRSYGTACTKRDIAKTDLEVVEVVYFQEKLGHAGNDIVEGGVYERVIDKNYSYIFFEDDVNCLERIGEAYLPVLG